MSLETIVNDLVTATDALHASITDKRTVLDNAAQQAAASLTTTKGLQTQAATSAATAAAKATEATNNANQVAAYKTAAAALDVTTTATAAVANLLPDMLAKKDPARHPFRKKMPTLVLDFERQKCHRYSPSTGFGETDLLPFMTFARNSSATYTGPDGLLKTAAANEARFDYDPLTGECKGLLVEEQRTNLFLSSHSLHTSGAWGEIANAKMEPVGVVSPNGTLTSSLFKRTATSASYALKSFITTAGVAVTFTLFVRRSNCDFLALRLQGAPTYSMHADVVFNLATGTVAQAASATGGYSAYASSIQALANGWFRVRLKVVTSADTWTIAAVSFSDQATQVDGASTSDSCAGVLWGAQLEAGAFPTSYIPTPATFTGRASTATYLDSNGVLQTAASGVARSAAYGYDSDGVLRPIGLLLENAATNLISYSHPAPAAMYSGPGTTATAVSDGRAILGEMLYSISGYTWVAVGPGTGNATLQAGTYCFSLYSTSESPIEMYLRDGDGYKTSTVIKATSGMFRHYTVFTLTTESVTNLHIKRANAHLVSGFMLESGNYPTSYIQTSGAQVTRVADTSTSAQTTRVADDAKVDGTKFSDFYNQTQGTLVAGATVAYVPTAYPRIVSVSKSGNFDDSINLYINGPTGKLHRSRELYMSVCTLIFINFNFFSLFICQC
jgi:hypothetical protein